MTEIYLIRHAQAEGNVYRMMQGHWDGDVTALGLRQIDALAARFRTVRVDALYSSDLYRARLTASAVSRSHPLPLHTTPLLREINVGRWETLFFGNVIHDEPELAHAFTYEQDRFSIEGGETYAEVGERAYAELERIARAHPGGSVAVVSHGVTIRCILSKITGVPLQDVEHLPICRNTSVARLCWDGGRFTVDYMDDIRHLAALGNTPWNKTGDLRDTPLDPATDRDAYVACYADAWETAHGSLKGFTPGVYFDAAVRHLEAEPRSVLRLWQGDVPAGLVDLDTQRGAHAGYSWVSLLYLCPDFRGRGYGPQALARAIFAYRALGRRTLRLHAAEDNTAALAFYRREGFRELSFERGSFGRLLLLEKSLRRESDG
ncbi:MAG: GNAT family N-acetyltransferase [Oscillospiraceae bacterium]|nr:GNAT family N-acetyltransferase [Oscillospiraceae bacterium]